MAAAEAMLVVGIGLVCIRHGAGRSGLVGRCAGCATIVGTARAARDRTGAPRVTPERAFPETGSIERGFVLPVLGACCLLLGVIGP